MLRNKIIVLLLSITLAVLGVTSFADSIVPGEIEVVIPNGGRDVPASIVLPEGEGPYPLVVINHGHGGSRQENGGFSGIAQALRNVGIASIRMDFPGCGESTVSFGENNMTNMISDSNASLQYMLDTYEINKDALGILGYSRGGRIAATVAAADDSPYAAVAFLAPNTNQTETEDAQAEYQIALAEGAFMQPWYGADLELSAKYYEDMFAGDALMASLPKMNPSIVVYGDQDTTIPEDVSLDCANQVGAEIVKVADADHGYGFYSDQPEVTQAVEGAFTDFFTKAFGLAK